MTPRRVDFTCRTCGARAHALDERLGVQGFLTPDARRLFCPAGAERSFEGAARQPREFSGLIACDDTVRKACDRHGGLMRARQREDPEADRAFAQAGGDVELQTDGTSVDTVDGWRETRLSAFAERQRGEPVTDLDAWPGERPPAPEARVASAGLKTSEGLGPRWRRAAARLGIKRTASITVPADGAGWIWNQVARSLSGAGGVLDFYHLVGHVTAAGSTLHGEATTAAGAWAGRVRRGSLGSGVEATLAGLKAGPEAVDALIAYLEPHAGHTD